MRIETIKVLIYGAFVSNRFDTWRGNIPLRILCDNAGRIRAASRGRHRHGNRTQQLAASRPTGRPSECASDLIRSASRELIFHRGRIAPRRAVLSRSRPRFLRSLLRRMSRRDVLFSPLPSPASLSSLLRAVAGCCRA